MPQRTYDELEISKDGNCPKCSKKPGMNPITYVGTPEMWPNNGVLVITCNHCGKMFTVVVE